MTSFKNFFLVALATLGRSFSDIWFTLSHPRALWKGYTLLWEEICDEAATILTALIWSAAAGLLGLAVFCAVKFLLAYATS